MSDVKVKARGEGPRAVQRIAVWQIDWMPVFGDILVYCGLMMVGSSERERRGQCGMCRARWCGEQIV